MDRNIIKYSQLPYPIDDVGDAKYVSSLSTILVASIQEAKDRISQIEYIFCSQLFPKFQSNSKTLQKIYKDAREAAEDAWKNKESDLVLQIERLQEENKMVLEENQSLKLENAERVGNREFSAQPFETNSSDVANSEKYLKELVEKNLMLIQKERTVEFEAQKIREELVKKSKEVDEGMELQNRLLQLVQLKENSILQKENQLKEQEQKKNDLLDQIESLEKNVRMSLEQLQEKCNEVMKERTVHEILLKENDSYVLKNLNNQQLLDECEKEKKLLYGKIESLEVIVNGLQRKMKIKNEEVEEGRKLQEQYLEQIDKNTKELLKTALQVEKLKRENLLLMDDRIGSQEKVDKLELGLRQRAKETSEGMELHGKLLKQIEEKDSELQSEKKKRGDLIIVHKNLKSQYNFLLAKFGLTTECSNRPNEIKDEGNSSKPGQYPFNSPGKLQAPGVDSGMKAPNQELLFTSNSPTAPIEPVNTRSGLLSGTKRSLSSWRGTRSHQQQDGFDPHDNFLDTPLENIIGNIKKSSKDKKVDNIPDLAPKEVNIDSIDDEETQDLSSKKPATGPVVKSGFKYIEPVRKRAERENLKGIECKQCRKFYDAVLPDGGDKNTDIRCEHHDGVSRHRYRHATIAGNEIWKIGDELFAYIGSPLLCLHVACFITSVLVATLVKS